MSARSFLHDAVPRIVPGGPVGIVPTCYGSTIPHRSHLSVFLAGPTVRTGLGFSVWMRPGWRGRALDALCAAGWRGHVIMPEWPRGGDHGQNKGRLGWSGRDVVAWENRGMRAATYILFWMPFALGAESDPASLPGFTTRFEIGTWLERAPHKVIAGCDSRLATTAILVGCEERGIRVHSDLDSAVAALIARSRRILP